LGGWGTIPEIPKTSYRNDSQIELFSCKKSGFAWLVCVDDYYFHVKNLDLVDLYVLTIIQFGVSGPA